MLTIFYFSFQKILYKNVFPIVCSECKTPEIVFALPVLLTMIDFAPRDDYIDIILPEFRTILCSNKPVQVLWLSSSSFIRISYVMRYLIPWLLLVNLYYDDIYWMLKFVGFCVMPKGIFFEAKCLYDTKSYLLLLYWCRK